jgi:hypothetical protein
MASGGVGVGVGVGTAGHGAEQLWYDAPEKGSRAKLALRTFDFLFLQGTQALEMHLRFLPSSLFPSLLLLRPFFAGVSGGTCAVLFSMADGWGGRAEAKMWGFDRAAAGRVRERFD